MITLPNTQRIFISPLANLTPQLLALQLDEFQAGNFFRVARTWEAIEARDDILKGVAGKRKKSPARLPWRVIALSEDPQAQTQRVAVEEMLRNISVTDASDKSTRGSLPLFIEMLMDAVGKKYSCLEYRFVTSLDGSVTTEAQFVPLWFFRKIAGELNFIDAEGNTTPLARERWIIGVSDGLMEASSIAYLYKHLPLRDWLIYCERNGMPGVKGTTTAQPGTPEWDNARRAVEEFGAEFSALLGAGATLEAIDLSAKGHLPYQPLVERMDRAMIALWRGGDMTTLSGQRAGITLQKNETALIEEHDASWVAQTINTQLVTPFIHHVFGPAQKPLVAFSIQPEGQLDREIAIFNLLKELQIPVPAATVYERLGLQFPANL